MQEVYQCIFGNPEGELATVTDKMTRMDETCKAFSTSHTCEGETWIEDLTSNELPYKDWPYSLREANMPYSGKWQMSSCRSSCSHVRNSGQMIGSRR